MKETVTNGDGARATSLRLAHRATGSSDSIRVAGAPTDEFERKQRTLTRNTAIATAVAFAFLGAIVLGMLPDGEKHPPIK